jgi:hypothetical protein
MNILRTTLATVSAIAASAVVIAGAEALAHANLSGGARFGAATVGYALGAMAGSAVATWFGVRHLGAAVTLLLAVLAAVNLFSFPHPLWFAPLAILMLVLGWVVGQRLGERFPGSGAAAR